MSRNFGTNSWVGVQTFEAGADANSQAITNVLDPVNPQDAATRAFVEAQVAEVPKAMRYDQDGSNEYFGFATDVNAKPSETKWQIFRLVSGGADDLVKRYASGTTAYDKEWDERATYSYEPAP